MSVPFSSLLSDQVTGLANSRPLCGIKDLRFHSKGLQCGGENKNSYYLGREEKLKLPQTQKQDSVVKCLLHPHPLLLGWKENTWSFLVSYLPLNGDNTFLFLDQVSLFCIFGGRNKQTKAGLSEETAILGIKPKLCNLFYPFLRVLWRFLPLQSLSVLIFVFLHSLWSPGCTLESSWWAWVC